MSKDYESEDNHNNGVNYQLEFEDSFESIEDIIHETCSKCGKVTVCENTVDECEEPTCEYEQAGEDYFNPGYSEIMFDEEGNYVKNFLGKEK